MDRRSRPRRRNKDRGANLAQKRCRDKSGGLAGLNTHCPTAESDDRRCSAAGHPDTGHSPMPATGRQASAGTPTNSTRSRSRMRVRLDAHRGRAGSPPGRFANPKIVLDSIAPARSSSLDDPSHPSHARCHGWRHERSDLPRRPRPLFRQSRGRGRAARDADGRPRPLRSRLDPSAAAAGVAALATFFTGVASAVLAMLFGVVMLRVTRLHAIPALAIGLLPQIMTHADWHFALAVCLVSTLLTASFLLFERLSRACGLVAQ